MRLLDLFCGAGGAAMGYYRAGFTEILGVDIAPQPRYPFPFVQAEALDFLRGVRPGEYAAVHASPPCQRYSPLASLQGGKEYPDLVAAVRAELERFGGVWVIENVGGAPLRNPVVLCGSSFGLNVWRHRLFEIAPQRIRHLARCYRPRCRHTLVPEPLDVTGTGGAQYAPRRTGNGGRSRKPAGEEEAGQALGIDWMTRRELAQAIPPAYTEWIGRQLAPHLGDTP